MNGFADFTIVEGRGFYRPVLETTLDEAVALIAGAIQHAREQGLKQLLVDQRGLTGFEPPNTFQRYYLMNRWVEAADSRVQVAMILRPEMVDPDNFGLRVAENRGFLTNRFETEEAAIAWFDGK
ncbi:hypothetical protein [Anatilimnocola floriformis]|uniref:hypothetical protein n=1 Tax=Anatilimnocola floriformis TaxID=2948575 RepID=UPI0020C389E7|nr:hypothetical protein [Anatilimnocola floriformis]